MLVQLSLGSRSVPLISILLGALVVVLFALACLALRASPRGRAVSSLAYGTLAASTWVLVVCGLQTGTDLELWLALAFAGASFIPPTLLHLVRHYPASTDSPSAAVIAASYLLAAVFAGCSATTSLLF